MAKRDNRQNNVERLQEIIANTKQNIEAAEETLHNDNLPRKQKQQIVAKNERRRDSIRALEEEIDDELRAQEKREI